MNKTDLNTDPDFFYNLPTGWHRTYNYPLRIREKDPEREIVLVSPDNDRGCEGECYWVSEFDVVET